MPWYLLRFERYAHVFQVQNLDICYKSMQNTN